MSADDGTAGPGDDGSGQRGVDPVYINPEGMLAHCDRNDLSAEQVGLLMRSIFARAKAGDTAVFVEYDFVAPVDPNDV
jgi:hypothetical protein